MKCGIDNVQGVKYIKNLDGENDAIAEVLTLEGKPLESIIKKDASIFPHVTLTEGKAKDVKIEDFEKLSKRIKELMNKSVADDKKLKQLKHKRDAFGNARKHTESEDNGFFGGFFRSFSFSTSCKCQCRACKNCSEARSRYE